VLACLVLWEGTTISYRPVLIGFTLAAAVGSIAAICLFFFNPLALIRAFRDSSEAQTMINWGRLPWQQAPLVPLALLSFLAPDIHPRRLGPVFYVASLAILAGLVATFSRTLIAEVVLFLLVLAVVCLFLRRRAVLAKIPLLVGGLVALAIVLVPLDPRVQRLFEYRVLGAKTEQSETVYSESDVAARQRLYGHYSSRLSRNWVAGQGLGVPYTDKPGEFYSDITLVSFWLPFGLPGLVAFGLFLLTIVRRLKRFSARNQPLAAGIGIAIVAGLLASFNDDIWSHKSFVLFLTFLVASLQDPLPSGQTNTGPEAEAGPGSGNKPRALPV